MDAVVHPAHLHGKNHARLCRLASGGTPFAEAFRYAVGENIVIYYAGCQQAGTTPVSVRKIPLALGYRTLSVAPTNKNAWVHKQFRNV